MNTALLRARAGVVRAIRSWFEDNGYLEVHTPTLVRTAAVEPHLETVEVGDGWFLHTSPELAMKRVLALGLPRIYQICPCYREEESGVHHTREFTMLEWYRAGAGTAELMCDTEEVIGVSAAALGLPKPKFQQVATTDLLDPTLAPDQWMFQWVDQIEPTLTEPTIVHSYPKDQAALARIRQGVADRFEVYLGGIELANAFAECTDPHELEARFKAGNAERRAAGKSPHPMDHASTTAMGRMPRCAGIAMGVDRLVMALTGASRISQVQITG
jgi:lysyl-tRNA synthetase class 2